MTAWVRSSPHVVRGARLAVNQSGDAFSANWSRDLDGGLFGAVSRHFYPVTPVIPPVVGGPFMRCTTEYVVYADPDDLAGSVRWSGWSDTVWSDRVDEGSVRQAARSATPPTDEEWSEAVLGWAVAS